MSVCSAYLFTHSYSSSTESESLKVPWESGLSFLKNSRALEKLTTMARPVSVYGYDTSMLSGSSVSAPQERTPCEMPEWHRLSQYSRDCPLLALPLELRQEILSYVLPTTVETRSKGVAWSRGHTAILMASKLTYAEGIRIIYGGSTFVIDLTWDRITFAYQWLLPTGLVPKRTLAFPDGLAARNISHIRRIVVRVHHVDNYTGMVKHNFGGPGLREGLRIQVERLCRTLQTAYQLSELRIRLQNDSHTVGVDQLILKPFLELKNVRTVKATGAVTAGFSRTLEKRLTNVYDRNSFFRLPLELRDRVYDLVLPHTETMFNTHPTQHKYVRWRYGHMTIMRTCSTIYEESSSLLYRTRNFQLTCGDDHFRFTPFWLPKGRLLPGLLFPQSIGTNNLAQIRHFTIYMPVWWGRTDEEGRQRRRTMLECMGKLLRSIPRIISLTLVCFCWNLASDWYEEAMQDILSIRGVSKIEIYGLDRDMAKRFKNKVKTNGGKEVDSMSHE